MKGIPMNTQWLNVIYDAEFGQQGVRDFTELCTGRGASTEDVLPVKSLRIRHGDDADVMNHGIDHPGGRVLAPGKELIDESHATTIDPIRHQADIQAQTETGVFRALCALARGAITREAQTKEAQTKEAQTKEALTHPRSSPRYAWRSLSLDVSRYKASIEEIERVIDLLALHGMSVLHLHLTDHQSWRIPVDGFDLLSQSPDCFTWKQLDGLKHYARQRHITLVPEIDLPGHCAALLERYPELAGRPSFAHPFLSYVNVRTEESRRFLSACSRSLSRLATGAYAHIGGDEVLGIPETDFNEAMRLLQDGVHERGLKTIAWQEGCRGKETADAYQFWMDEQDIPSEESLVGAWPQQFSSIARQAAAMYALCRDDPRRLRAKGSMVIDSQQSFVYLDRKYAEQSQIPEQNERMRTLGFPGYAPKNSTEPLGWSPISDGHGGTAPGIDQSQASLTAGVEAALWTETVRSTADMDMLLLPRLALIADFAWTGNPRLTQDGALLQRVRDYAKVWTLLGYDDFYRSSSLFPRLG